MKITIFTVVPLKRSLNILSTIISKMQGIFKTSAKKKKMFLSSYLIRSARRGKESDTQVSCFLGQRLPQAAHTDAPGCCRCLLVAQSCPALCKPTDCSPSGSSVHGILQMRILEVGWPCPPLGDLPDPAIESMSPAWQADSLPPSHL